MPLATKITEHANNVRAQEMQQQQAHFHSVYSAFIVFVISMVCLFVTAVLQGYFVSTVFCDSESIGNAIESTSTQTSSLLITHPYIQWMVPLWLQKFIKERMPHLFTNENDLGAFELFHSTLSSTAVILCISSLIVIYLLLELFVCKVVDKYRDYISACYPKTLGKILRFIPTYEKKFKDSAWFMFVFFAILVANVYVLYKIVFAFSPETVTALDFAIKVVGERPNEETLNEAMDHIIRQKILKKSNVHLSHVEIFTTKTKNNHMIFIEYKYINSILSPYQ